MNSHKLPRKTLHLLRNLLIHQRCGEINAGVPYPLIMSSFALILLLLLALSIDAAWQIVKTKYKHDLFDTHLASIGVITR